MTESKKPLKCISHESLLIHPLIHTELTESRWRSWTTTCCCPEPKSAEAEKIKRNFLWLNKNKYISVIYSFFCPEGEQTGAESFLWWNCSTYPGFFCSNKYKRCLFVQATFVSVSLATFFLKILKYFYKLWVHTEPTADNGGQNQPHKNTTTRFRLQHSQRAQRCPSPCGLGH